MLSALIDQRQADIESRTNQIVIHMMLLHAGFGSSFGGNITGTRVGAGRSGGMEIGEGGMGAGGVGMGSTGTNMGSGTGFGSATGGTNVGSATGGFGLGTVGMSAGTRGTGFGAAEIGRAHV